jgi:hypothetical protein
MRPLGSIARLLPVSALALCAAALVAGCGIGGGKSGNKADKRGLAAGVTSQTIAYRTLDQGPVTDITDAPTSGLSLVAAVQSEHDTIWAAHRGLEVTPPAVDFASERVVFLALPELQTTTPPTLSVVEVVTDEVGLVVRFQVVAGVAALESGSRARPFHAIAILDATSRPVRAEPVQGQAQDPSFVSAHGTVVYGPDAPSGRPTLLVLVDGAAAPLEVKDSAGLYAAGARPGQTLSFRGPVDPNASGLTAAGYAITIAEFVLDDVQTSVRVNEDGLLEDVEGMTYEAVGPLAAAFAEAGTTQPLRVTGRIDFAPSTVGEEVPALVVTSIRRTRMLCLERCAADGSAELVAIDDLDGTFAYRVSRCGAAGACEVRGRGQLSASEQAAVVAALATADLRSRTPLEPVANGTGIGQGGMTSCQAPAGSTVLTLVDEEGEVSVGAAIAPEVEALATALCTIGDEAPVLRTLVRATTSTIREASARYAKNQPELTALWGEHAGSPHGMPTVDFTTSRVVGVFLGVATPAEGSVEAFDVERIGDVVSLRVARIPASEVTGAATAAHFVAIDNPTTRTLAFGVLGQ